MYRLLLGRGECVSLSLDERDESVEFCAEDAKLLFHIAGVRVSFTGIWFTHGWHEGRRWHITLETITAVDGLFTIWAKGNLAHLVAAIAGCSMLLSWPVGVRRG